MGFGSPITLYENAGKASSDAPLKFSKKIFNGCFFFSNSFLTWWVRWAGGVAAMAACKGHGT